MKQGKETGALAARRCICLEFIGRRPTFCYDLCHKISVQAILEKFIKFNRKSFI
jgi:hypothetical protein